MRRPACLLFTAVMILTAHVAAARQIDQNSMAWVFIRAAGETENSETIHATSRLTADHTFLASATESLGGDDKSTPDDNSITHAILHAGMAASRPDTVKASAVVGHDVLFRGLVHAYLAGRLKINTESVPALTLEEAQIRAKTSIHADAMLNYNRPYTDVQFVHWRRFPDSWWFGVVGSVGAGGHGFHFSIFDDKNFPTADADFLNASRTTRQLGQPTDPVARVMIRQVEAANAPESARLQRANGIRQQQLVAPPAGPLDPVYRWIKGVGYVLESPRVEQLSPLRRFFRGYGNARWVKGFGYVYEGDSVNGVVQP